MAKNNKPKKTQSKSKAPSASKRRISDSGDHNKVPKGNSVVRLETPVKSSADANQYRLIQLPNGIRALLISKPQTQKNPPLWHHRSCNTLGFKDDWLLYSDSLISEAPIFPLQQKHLQWINRPDFTRNLLQNPIMSEKDRFSPRQTFSQFDMKILLNPDNMFGDLFSQAKPSADLDSKLKASFALTVNVGSSNDPPTHLGLAHFCEHMVHYGSLAYPAEEAYTQFISEHGEGFNAFTQCMTTTYHFAVEEDSLEKGMDIFSNLMAFPAFNRDCIGREVHSIDHEFMLKENLDLLACHQIILSTANKNHPLGQFACGNLQTLQNPVNEVGLDNLQKALKTFHKNFYVGSAMTVTLMSSASLDSMEKVIVGNLSRIPNGNRKIRCLETIDEDLMDPFDNDQFNHLYFVKGREEYRRLIVTWALPPEAWKDWRRKPMALLEVLMNDEWTGGLPVFLRSQGWIVDFSASCLPAEMHRNDYTTLLQINAVLTEEGRQKVTGIIEAVYSYLKRIQETPLQKKIDLWTELNDVSCKYFEHSGAGDSSSLTLQSARLLQIIKEPAELFRAEAMNGSEYNDDVFKSYLDMLNPSNMNIMMVIPQDTPGMNEISFDKREPYTGIEYRDCAFVNSFIKTLEEMKPLPVFAFISQNQYSPPNEIKRFNSPDFSDTGLEGGNRTYKKVMVCHSRSSNPAVLKATLGIYFISGVIRRNDLNSLCLTLWGGCLRNNLLTEVSAIQRAGVDIRIGALEGTIFFNLCGFSNSFYPALKIILTKSINDANSISQATFEIVKNHLIDTINMNIGNYEHQIGRLLQELSTMDAKSNEEILKAVKSISYTDFLNFLELFKSSCMAIVCLNGNAEASDSRLISSFIEDLDTSPDIGDWDSPGVSPRIINFRREYRCLRGKSTKYVGRNNVIVNLYQLCPNAGYGMEIAAFLANQMAPRAFQILRTQQQLGYVVGCATKTVMDSIVLIIFAVSPGHKHSACKVDQAMDQFIVTFYENYLKKMTAEEFKRAKNKLRLVSSWTLENTKAFYRANLLGTVNKRNGEIKNGKLSIQLMCDDKEKCPTVERCKESEWMEPTSAEQTMNFVRDLKDNVVPYFIRDLKEYRSGL